MCASDMPQLVAKPCSYNLLSCLIIFIDDQVNISTWPVGHCDHFGFCCASAGCSLLLKDPAHLQQLP